MRLTGPKGFVIGVAILAAMQLVLSSSRGTQAFGIATNLPTRWLEDWFDPTQPLISDHRSGSSSGANVQDCSKVSGDIQRQACVASQPPGQRQCSLLGGLAQTLCSAGIGPAVATQGQQTPTQIPTTSATAAQLSV